MRSALPSVRRTRVLAALLATLWLLSATAAVLANGVTGPGGWHRVDLPGITGQSRLEGVASRGDGFVAVGTDDGLVGPAVWLSADGASWEKVSDIDRPDDAAMNGVASASPGYVAVGRVANDAAVWVAVPEGEAWRQILDADFNGARMNAVDDTWAGTIAVGHDPDTGSAAIWRRDLDVWSRIGDSPDFAGINLLGVVTGSFVLLAVGEDVRDGSGAALVSADGETWTRVEAAEARAHASTTRIGAATGSRSWEHARPAASPTRRSTTRTAAARNGRSPSSRTLHARSSTPLRSPVSASSRSEPDRRPTRASSSTTTGVVFGLLPVRFMPGAALYVFSRRVWAVLFGIGIFGLLHVLINPTSGYLADATRTPLITIVALFAAFGLVSVGLWAYFRFRRTSACIH